MASLPTSLTCFCCPACERPLAIASPCACGFDPRRADGIVNLLTAEDAARTRAFRDFYGTVRRAEGWGDDDLDLPFHPRRHRAVWAVRQRTFRRLETLASRIERGVALDIGAGTCWLTRHLAQWKFDAVAVDISDDPADGLGAAAHYLERGARFARVLADMTRLPVSPASVSLIVANASFHYANDPERLLASFARALTPDGAIVVLDTPCYDTDAAGRRMMSDRAARFTREYGAVPETDGSGFLTLTTIDGLAQKVGLDVRVVPVWPGPRRSFERLRARLRGTSIARFPLIVFTHRRPE